MEIQTTTEEQDEINAQKRAQSLGLNYENLHNLTISQNTLNLLPFQDARDYQLVPFQQDGKLLRVASLSVPLGPAKTRLVRLKQQTGYDIEVVIVSPSSLSFALKQYARLLEKVAEDQKPKVKTQPSALDLNSIKTVSDVHRLAKVADTTNLLEIILYGAVAADASDIHIEPGKAGFTVRYRLDGVLYDVLSMDQLHLHSLISRIKIQSGLRLNENSVAQDSSFEKKYQKCTVDFRVSIIPTQYGESVVLRLARSDRAFIPLEQLGFSERDQVRIEAAVQKTQGTIITTGPTGSGKTTTLYAILNILNKPDKKIITLEDPIEYHLEGIEQSQINPRGDYDFAVALRAVLRQDPNVVMVGEIRDPETAKVCFEAAMTGHLVLTTMHAMSAVQTYNRLLGLGLKVNNLVGTVNLVINQRLARRICQNCGGRKCDVCHRIGYKGRIAIAETLVPSPDFERALSSQQDNSVLLDLARQNGMRLISEDAEEKVTAGLTTAEEVARILG